MKIIQIIPMQVLAYELAVRRGLDPDRPRNLVKSVTVSEFDFLTCKMANSRFLGAGWVLSSLTLCCAAGAGRDSLASQPL
jgi:hypothetical protein